MSATYAIDEAVIKLDSMANQISKAVYELKRHNVREPYTVRLTQDQYDLLRRENNLTYIHDKAPAWTIHGCRIEVVK